MKPDASPTARVLLVLELIQSSPGITADRLADKLGVSERADSIGMPASRRIAT